MTKINFQGSIEDVKKQIEQTIATYELLGNQTSVKFETWFEKWETGFLTATENRTLGNYQLTGENAWRADAGKRPRFRQWENDQGIITGEYWRDRNNDATSLILSGTPEMLIDQIIQIEHRPNGGGKTTESEFTGGGEVKRKGRPQLYIYFVEDEADVETGYKPIASEISMRLMNQTESSLSRADLNQYTAKIQSVFGTNGGRIWKRGKDMASYTDWENGYQLQLLVRSTTDGEELIKHFLAIQNAPFIKKKYFYSENQDTVNAYPTIPGEEVILGKTVKKTRHRPIAEIKFQSAWISLPSIRKPIYLIDVSGENKIFSD
ncbi:MULTISPECIES: hypothetical protein [unclassified Microcoleus]|uniref:hypothetical protein n=1 Tax=unclassified Microcoleus TaxID=2642155 RepID=UPI002FD21A12